MGGETAFDTFAAALQAHGLGLILDAELHLNGVRGPGQMAHSALIAAVNAGRGLSTEWANGGRLG